jgi:hypothetical protein
VLTEEAEDRPTHWQGRYIKSDPEWWAIKGLMQLGIEFRYQYSVFGGQSARGGFVVDFLIDLPPRPFPFEIWGGYWHEGQKGGGDRMREIILANYFGVRRIKGLYQNDLGSEESVLMGLRRELM